MKKLGYFPGCSLLGTALEYNESIHEVAKAFDIMLEEVNDWNCCGATAAHNLNKLLSIALPARTLVLAGKQGLEKILVPCAACYNRLIAAWHEINHDAKIRNKISDIIELQAETIAKPISILDFLTEFIIPELEKKSIKEFNRQVVCYYGCLLVRPDKIIKFDRFEDPQVMEEALKIIGSHPLDWGYKTECCGAGLSVARTSVVAKLSGKIIEDAEGRGAEAIIVACPMCHSNLDMRRMEINSFRGKNSAIPIMYITQAIALALGIDQDKLGFKRHFIPVESMLNSPVKISNIKDKMKAKTKGTEV